MTETANCNLHIAEYLAQLENLKAAFVGKAGVLGTIAVTEGALNKVRECPSCSLLYSALKSLTPGR